MDQATLTIDLSAIAANWRALDALSGKGVQTAAVVKADGYGLGAARVATHLAGIGVRSFFVALPAEGLDLRRALGPGPRIHVFAGLMPGWAAAMREADLTPLLNSAEQARDFAAAAGAAFGLQLDSGMNRLGIEAADLAEVRAALPGKPELVMSHLACADVPDDPQNASQLANFRAMTDGLDAPRSLAATGGILIGPAYHFDMTRPGVGLYGGQPFAEASPVVTLDVPVIQIRDVAAGEPVGYGAAWIADAPARIATVAAGYADGLLRAIGSGHARMFAGDIPCPLVGRVSMDLITVDVSALPHLPRTLRVLGTAQNIDDLAAAGGTIGYEILTSLGHRYKRVYKDAN